MMADNSKSPTVITAETKNCIEKIQFRWSISNFSFMRAYLGEKIESPLFSSDNRINWVLWLYPFGDVPESENYLSFYLFPKSRLDKGIVARFTFAIVDISGNSFNAFHWEPFLINHGGGVRKYISRMELYARKANLLPNDTLTLQVDLEYLAATVSRTDCMADLQLSADIGPVNLCDDLSALYKSGAFSDVTVVVGQTEYSAHRVVLAAASPVFASMLQHEMSEKRTGRIVIEDFKANTIHTLLELIYGGEMTHLTNMTLAESEKLLKAADKYQMEKLKSILEKSLSQLLSVESALPLLVIADRYNSHKLKAYILKFIQNNRLEVMATRYWRDGMVCYPDLFIELINYLCD